MKKWIQEALKKAGYFTLIAAMLICSLPLQTIAAVVTNDKQTVSADQNKSAGSSVGASSLSNAGNTENGKISGEKAASTESAGSTENNHVTGMESGNTTSPNSAKGTDSGADKGVQKPEGTTNGSNVSKTDELKNDVSAAAGTETGKNSNTSSSAGNPENSKTLVNPSNSQGDPGIDVINNVKVISEITKKYCYEEGTEKRSYQVTISGKAEYGILGEISDEDRDTALSRYKLKLTLTKTPGDNDEETTTIVEEKGLKDAINNNEVKISDYLITSNTELKWKVEVLKDEETVPVAVEEKTEPITMPEEISVTFGEITGIPTGTDFLQYTGKPDGSERYFKAAIDAETTAAFNIDSIEGDSLEAEKTKELEKYKLKVHVEGPTGQLYDEDRAFQLSESDYNTISIADAAQTEFDFKEDGDYSWYAVITKEGAEVPDTKKEGNCNIKIPDPIQVEFSNLALAEAGCTPKNEEGECKSFDLSLNTSFDISVSGLDETNVQVPDGTQTTIVPATDRTEEVRDCLDKIKLELQEDKGIAGAKEDWVKLLDINLDVKQLADALVNSPDHTTTFSENKTVNPLPAGDYAYRTVLTKADGTTLESVRADVEIEHLAQDFEYVTSDGKNTYKLGETFTYSLAPGTNAYGTVTCYESDKDGNAITNDQHLTIQPSNDGSYQIAGRKEGTSYVSFRCAGNDIYAEATKTYAITIEKEKLEGTISIYDTQSGFAFWKGDALKIIVSLDASKSDTLGQYYPGISLAFTAVSEGIEKETISLGNMSSDAAVYSEKNQKVTYEYTVKRNIVSRLKDSDTYTIKAKAAYQGQADIQYEALTLEYKNFSATKKAPYIKAPENLSIGYGTEHQLTVEVFEKKNGKPLTQKMPYSISYKSHNTEVATVDENGKISAVKGGTAKIEVVVDDATDPAAPDDEKIDVYQTVSTFITVKVTAPQNTNYTINGDTPEEFQKRAVIIKNDSGKEEYWYDKDITITPEKDSPYNEVVYRKTGGAWTSAGEKWVIGETMPTDYEFYFCNKDLNIYSYDEVSEKNNVENAKKTLSSVGVASKVKITNANVTIDDCMNRTYFYENGKNGYDVKVSGAVGYKITGDPANQEVLKKTLSRYTLKLTVDAIVNGKIVKSIENKGTLGEGITTITSDSYRASQDTTFQWKLEVYKDNGTDPVAVSTVAGQEEITMPKDVSVNIDTLTVTSGTDVENSLIYASEPDGTKRHFISTITGAATAHFDNGEIPGDQRTKEKGLELEKYKLRICMIDPHNIREYFPKEGIDFQLVGDDTITIDYAELANYNFSKTGKYQWYAQVVKKDNPKSEEVIVKSAEGTCVIDIPDKIGLEISNLEVKNKCIPNNDIESGQEITSYQLPVTVSAEVNVTGIGKGVSADKRQKEIAYCLEQNKLTLSEKTKGAILWDKLTEISLNSSDFADTLVKNDDHKAVFTYTTDKNNTVVVKSAGTYQFWAELNTGLPATSLTKTLDVTIDPIQQEFQYVNIDQTYIIGETYMFALDAKRNLFGAASCYESDQDGNPIKGSSSLKLEMTEDGAISTIKSDKNAIGTHYVSFQWGGTEIYAQARRTYKIKIEKADLTGSVTICNVERKSLFAFLEPDKADPFEITTTLEANQIELLKTCYRDISVKLSAIPNDSKDKTVELGEVKGNKADCSETDNKVVYTFAVPEKRMNQLKGGSHYTIQADLVFANADTFAYQGGPFTFENFKVQNIAPYIDIEGQQIEFGTEKNLAFTVYDRKGDNAPAKTPLSYRFALKNPEDKEVVTIDKNGVLHPVSSKRSVEVIVTVDDVDNEVEDRYNETSATVMISVTPPQNTDFTINNFSKEEFIGQYQAFIENDGNNEYWYDDNITISLGKDNLYDEIVYRKVNGSISDGSEADSKWINAGDVWTIEESSVTDYEFYFCDTERNLYSYDTDTSMNLVKDALKTLDDVGVDKTAPDAGTLLSADRKANSHSTDNIHYFSDGVDFTAYSKGSADKTASIDEGTGIEKVYVKYGDQKWQEVDNFSFTNRYDSTYTLPLNDNKIYGTISVKAVDFLGHESIAVEYKGSYGTDKIHTSSVTPSAVKVCIDKVHPVIKAVSYSVDASGKQTAYDGSWTNHQLQYLMSLETQQSSGIYRYQYTFVPRGTEFDPAKTSWTNVSPAEMKVVLGTILGEKNQNTYSGTFRYPNEEIDIAPEKPASYEQKNGVIYFRAESNASLVTEERDIADSMQQVRIWQENIENPKVYADNRFDASTGWYNQKTGAVNLSFAYPEYQEEKYAPAVGVIYELHQKTLTEDTVVKKAFYKGILDENKGTVVEVSDYTRPRSTTSLSGDGTIHIDSDSINELVVYTQDFAGNKSDKAVYTVKADYNAPNQLKMYVDETEQTPHTSLDERIAYRSFSRNEVTVKGEADYGISGKQNLLMQKCKNLGDWNGLSNAVSTSQVTLAPSTRGFVYMYAVDGAGNSAEAWSDGIATDNQAPVGPDNSDISIQAFGANSKGFFNSDFKVAVSVKDAPSDDDYSGLNSVMYTVGRGDSETKSNVSLFQFDAERPFWEDIIKSSAFAKDDILVSAFENESNEAYLKVTAVDNAGNIKTTSQVFMIDVTKPVIDVTFDKTNENNSKYYNTDRTATIQITELNFDPNLVRFQIYKDGAVIDSLTPSADSWVSAGGNVHTANITFHEDGDYTFSVECTDMADNFSEYQEKVEEFTIDQTIPEVEVSYDNDTAWKDSYFNAPRTATITVEEHNFDETAFEAAVSPKVSLSGWSHAGDTHKATLNFSTDEHYIYTLHCTDLAGNEMEPFEEEEFYIDTEEPEITITGVADQSANAGDVIPVVIANDTNYDESGIKITLQNSKGNQITLTPERTSSEGGHAYRLTGVNGQPDEIYTLTAAATDMAGNESEISYRFSLNRHGSTYDLSNMSGLVEKVYTRYADMGDLEILETNVDVIEDFTVYISRNGEMLSESQVNALPGTKDADTIYYSSAVSGNDELGYQYRYTIYKENFEQEGVYNIMFYSKDRAGNEVNNTLSEKGAEITFVVDNTAPTVVMEGVEAGQFYAEDSKEVNVYTSDNFKLKKAEFYLVDETGATVQTYDYMELAENEGDVVTLILPNSDKKLSLTYSTIDAAGNNLVTLQNSPDIPSGFMITTNAWLRYINNNAAVAATVGGVGAAGAASAGGTALFRRRKLKRFHKK